MNSASGQHESSGLEFRFTQISRPEILASLFTFTGCRNLADYGFNHVHEGRTARRSLLKFILCPEKGRSRAWGVAKKEGKVVGFGIYYRAPEQSRPQLRLLLSIAQCAELGFGPMAGGGVDPLLPCPKDSAPFYPLDGFKGLDRAIRIYESIGFLDRSQKRVVEGVGGKQTWKVPL